MSSSTSDTTTGIPSRRSLRIARFRAEAAANDAVAIFRSPCGRYAQPIRNEEPTWPKTAPTHAREKARRVAQWRG